MLGEKDVNKIRDMPLEQRFPWESYLNKYETPFRRIELMVAQAIVVASRNSKLGVDDVMIKPPKIETVNEEEQAQIMLAQMQAWNKREK